MTNTSLIQDEDETTSEAVKTEAQKPENQDVETDPFFGTGHFSIHHQPGYDEDETFIGE